MDRIVKVGIIGCGGIANGKHMPSLHAIPRRSVLPEQAYVVSQIPEAVCTSSKTGKQVYFE